MLKILYNVNNRHNFDENKSESDPRNLWMFSHCVKSWTQTQTSFYFECRSLDVFANINAFFVDINF